MPVLDIVNNLQGEDAELPEPKKKGKRSNKKVKAVKTISGGSKAGSTRAKAANASAECIFINDNGEASE